MSFYSSFSQPHWTWSALLQNFFVNWEAPNKKKKKAYIVQCSFYRGTWVLLGGGVQPDQDKPEPTLGLSPQHPGWRSFLWSITFLCLLPNMLNMFFYICLVYIRVLKCVQQHLAWSSWFASIVSFASFICPQNAYSTQVVLSFSASWAIWAMPGLFAGQIQVVGPIWRKWQAQLASKDLAVEVATAPPLPNLPTCEVSHRPNVIWSPLQYTIRNDPKVCEYNAMHNVVDTAGFVLV